MKQAFALPKGGAGFAETSDRSSRIVFQVNDIVPGGADDSDNLRTLCRGCSIERV